MSRPFNPEPNLEPIPGYQLNHMLGRGGFGEVWQATAPGGFHVALKFVPLGAQHGNAELRSLEILRTIRHPNLLLTLGAWQVEGSLVIAMELADQTLHDRFEAALQEGHRGIPGPELHEYLREAANGIDFLNSPQARGDGMERGGVQHRDIKPQNILCVGSGVKVADFGLARFLAKSVTGHTGSLTPAYAAPEFFHGQTSNHSDQYSLAVTYCHLRCGHLPFEGNMAEIMAGHLSRAPNLESLPPNERPAVGRALAKEPSHRWPNCRAFADALAASRAGGGARQPLQRTAPITPASHPPVPSCRTIFVADAPPASTPTPTLRDVECLPSRRGTRHGPRFPVLQGIFSFACAIGIFGGTFAMLMRQTAPPEPEEVAEVQDAPAPLSHSEPVPEKPPVEPLPAPVEKEPAPSPKPVAAEPKKVEEPLPPPPPPEQAHPSLAASVPGMLTIHSGEEIRCPLTLLREHCPGAIGMHFDGLPAGVQVFPLIVPDGRDQAYATIRALPTAPASETLIRVKASAESADGETQFRLRVEKPLHSNVRTLPVILERAEYRLDVSSPKAP